MTYDGARVNGTMVKELGADPDENEPYILHSTTLERVYCFPDPTHMIKNARNALGETARHFKKMPESAKKEAASYF